MGAALLRPTQATSRGAGQPLGWADWSGSQSLLRSRKSRQFSVATEKRPRGLLPLQANAKRFGSGFWHFTARTHPYGKQAVVRRKASLWVLQTFGNQFKSLHGGLFKALHALRQPPLAQAVVPLVRSPTLAVRGLLRIFGSSGGPRLEEVEDGVGGTLSIDKFEEQGRRERLAGAVIALLVYFGFGFFYGRGIEGWTITDALYFVVVTLSTVGYGDKHFDLSRWDEVFGGLYVFFGVAFIGAAAGEIISQIQARAEKAALRLKEKQRKANNNGYSRDLAGELKRGATERQFESGMEFRALRRQLLRSTVLIVLSVLIGSVVMCRLEGWTLSYAFMWACVTGTTVGYGDQVASTASGKWFTMAYILFSIGFAANALSCVARIPNEVRRITDTQRVLTQFGDSLEAEELGALLDSHEIQSLRTRVQALESKKHPSVSRTEFVLWLLVKTNKLDLQRDVGPCLEVFDQLDPDESGVLDQDDIDAFERMKANAQIKRASTDTG